MSVPRLGKVGAFVVGLALAGGCELVVDFDRSKIPEAGATDAGMDASSMMDAEPVMDAGSGDAAVDTGPDAGSDGGEDAGMDASMDASADAAVDGGPDAGMDAGMNGGDDAAVADGGPDAGMDAGSADAGECTDDTDCSGTEPICDTSTNTCVPCMMDSECPNVCDEGTGACVECVDDADCDDAVACTVDVCGSGNDSCEHVPVGNSLETVGYETGTSSADQVRLDNPSSAVSVDFGGYYLCASASGDSSPTCMEIASGTTAAADGNAVIEGLLDVSSMDGELALSTMSDGSGLCDYVQWGEGGHLLEGTADSAGQWTSGDFVDTSGVMSGEALCWDETQADNNSPAMWDATDSCTF
jgi:hypothetical protein